MLTMLATALLGGQVFADVTGTGIQGATEGSASTYYGTHTTSEIATGGKVTIKTDNQGTVPNNATVYGGRADAAEASNNTVTMQGGIVGNIYGGSGFKGDSYNNTVIMTGGSVNMLYGGSASNDYMPSRNVVIVTGGSITGALMAGGSTGIGAQNNKVHLVGKGASNVTIADGQGITSTYSYTGVDAGISFAYVYGGYAPKGTSSGNSIDIYGTGITITKQLQYAQILTFNITNGQMTEQATEAALILTTTTTKLDGVDLQIKDLDVKEWTPGKTITLVQSEQEISGLERAKAVNIMKDGKAVALGKLVLSDDNKTLSLNVQGSVPEPATGTLGVFALAALAARRRKK